MLGRDHPQRPVPVHREHRVEQHLPLRDQARWCRARRHRRPL